MAFAANLFYFVLKAKRCCTTCHWLKKKLRIVKLTRGAFVSISARTGGNTCSTTSVSLPIKVVQIRVNPVAHVLREITGRATVLIFGALEDRCRGWSR